MTEREKKVARAIAEYFWGEEAGRGKVVNIASAYTELSEKEETGGYIDSRERVTPESIYCRIGYSKKFNTIVLRTLPIKEKKFVDIN